MVNDTLLQEALKRHGDKRSTGYYLETGLHRSNKESMNDIVTQELEVSHGEGYIHFFESKLRKNTLYLLDEPETPLSFQNQLSLIKLIDDYVKEGSQFIICTHSPILLAYPKAKIYFFDEKIRSMVYEEHPLIKDYQAFLSNPKRFMHYLLD